MASHADIFDDRDSLRNPFIASVLFHAAVLAFFVVWTIRSEGNKIVIGTANPGFGNSVAINPVPALPLPARKGQLNPLANDTESLVPQREAKKAEPRVRRPEPPKDAIPLKSRPEKPVPHDYLLQKYRSHPVRENQLTSTQAPAANSMMFNKPGSTQGVGINPNSVLGERFGGYAQALMEAVARHWNTGGLAGVRAPVVIVNVDVMRNGSIRNPRVAQPSGNSTLDYSCLRAVNDAAPFPPLPPEYSGSYLNVDFQFQLHP